MIQDLLSNAIGNNLKLSLENKFLNMEYAPDKNSAYKINCSKENIFAKKVIFVMEEIFLMSLNLK